MKNDGSVRLSAKTDPVWVAGAGAVLTAVLLVVIGWAAWTAHRSELRERELHHLQGALVGVASLDESLTRAVRMAALTGEADWIVHYGQLERQMSDVVRRTRELAPRAGAGGVATRMEAANMQRMRIEREALMRAREGGGAEALRMISAAEYNTHKGHLAEACAELSRASRGSFERESTAAGQRLATAALLFTLGALGLLATWGIVITRPSRFVAERDWAEERERREAAAQRESEDRFRHLAENIGDVFWVVTADLREGLYISPAYETVWGRSLESFYEGPQTWADAIHEDDRERVLALAALERVQSEGYDGTYRIRRPDGEIRWIHARAFPARDEHDEVFRVVGVAKDITELQETERQLAEAQATAQLGSWEWHIAAGTVTWSDEMYRIFGVRKDEYAPTFEGYLERVHPEDLERVRATISEGFTAGSFEFVCRFLLPSGEVRYEAARGRVVAGDEGQPTRMVGTAQDITDRWHVENALRESEERFRQLAENMDEVFWMFSPDFSETLYINPAYESIFGLPCQGLYDNPAAFADVVHPDDRPRLLEAMAGLVKEPQSVVIRIERPDGERRILHARGTPVRNERGEVYRITGLTADVTDQKQIEEALAEQVRTSSGFAAALDHLTTGVLITDPAQPDNPVVYANRGFTAVTGYAAHEVLGRNARLLQGPDTEARVVAEVREAIRERRPYHGRVLNYRKDGTCFWNEMTISPVFDAPGGDLISFVGLESDITKMVEAEARLVEQVREKTALLAEVHHRVKNNLQIISSLLNMQIRSLHDQTAIEALRESQNRTRAIALVHETLYRSGNYAQVQLSDYLRQLLQHVRRSLGIGRDVEVTLELEPVTVALHQAVPCGLILNELVTNALKHAFPDGGAGEVRVALTRVSQARCTLTVSDDGTGLPHQVDVENPRSVGLQLVQMLSEQIGAEVQVRRAPGTEFIITFPVAEEQSP